MSLLGFFAFFCQNYFEFAEFVKVGGKRRKFCDEIQDLHVQYINIDAHKCCHGWCSI